MSGQIGPSITDSNVRRSATVTVILNGDTTYEFERTLQPWQMWYVADITWSENGGMVIEMPPETEPNICEPTSSFTDGCPF